MHRCIFTVRQIMDTQTPEQLGGCRSIKKMMVANKCVNYMLTHGLNLDLLSRALKISDLHGWEKELWC